MSFIASAPIRTGVLSVDIFYIETPPASARVGDIASVGNLKYEYDITDSNTDVNRLYVNYASIELKFFQYARDGRDWAEDLIQIINTTAGADQKTTMTVSLAKSDGQTYRWLFDVYSDSIKIDERTRMVTITGVPYTNSFDSNVLLWTYASFAGLPYNMDYVNRNSNLTTDFCMTAGHYIEAVLRQATAGLGLSYFIESSNLGLGSAYSTKTYDKLVNTAPVDNDYYICVRQTSDLPADERALNPISIVARLCAVEGGVFGMGHGIAFYFNKMSKANQVTMGYDQLTDLSVDSYSRAVRDVRVRVQNDNDTSVVGGVFVANQLGDNSFRYNTYGARNMDVFFIPDGLVVGEYFAVGRMKEAQATQTLNAMNALAQRARETYGQTFGVSNKKTISFKAFGIDSLKPYQTLKFDTSVPAKYQGILFRPSYLEYSLVEDTVTGRAYEIGTP
jgi:hypothetical protein